MTDISWDEVHRLAGFLEKQTNYDAADTVRALRVALDAAEGRKVPNPEALSKNNITIITEALAPSDKIAEAARAAHEALWELNPDNYDHDDVLKLNDASVEAIFLLADAIGETHGKTPEWWEARRRALAGQGETQ